MRFKTCSSLDGGVLWWWLHIRVSDILIKLSQVLPTCYHLSWGPLCIINMEVESSCWWKAFFYLCFPVGDSQCREHPRGPMADGWKSSQELVTTTVPRRAQLMHSATQSFFPDFRRGTSILAHLSLHTCRSEMFDKYRWFTGLKKVSSPQKKGSMQLKHYTALVHLRKIFLSSF